VGGCGSRVGVVHMVSLVWVVVDHGGLGSLFVGGCRLSTGWDSSSICGGC
jgi:hypothetical protein